MGAGQSSLSSTGFDYVVAVTQDSINAALEEYLFSGQPEVILCYVYDESVPPNPVPADYATLVAQADNTDPFAVPDGTPPDDPRVMKLSDAGFAFAVKAKLGPGRVVASRAAAARRGGVRVLPEPPRGQQRPVRSRGRPEPHPAHPGSGHHGLAPARHPAASHPAWRRHRVRQLHHAHPGHRVLKNVVRQYLARSLNGLSDVRAGLQAAFTDAQGYLDGWAGIPDNIPPALRDSGLDSATASSGPPPGTDTPQGNWGLYQLTSNATGVEPFPDNATTTALINAPDFASIQRICQQAGGPGANAAGALPADASISPSLNNALVLAGGVCSAVGAAGLCVFGPLKQKFPEIWVFSIISTCLYPFYVAPDIIGQIPDLLKKKWWVDMNGYIATAMMVKSVADMAIAQKAKDATSGAAPASIATACCRRSWLTMRTRSAGASRSRRRPSSISATVRCPAPRACL
jgi:hypothetical protein